MVKSSFFSQDRIFIFMLIISIIEYAFSTSELCGCLLINQNDDQRGLLTNLKNHTLCGQKFTIDAGDHYEYNFVICGDVNNEMSNVSLEKRDTVQPHTFIPLGFHNATSAIGMTGHGAWTMLTFYPPPSPPKNESEKNASTPLSCQNHSSVLLVCDKNFPDGEFRFGYFDKDLCLYVFELRIAALCDEKSGLGGFSVFLIILVVVFAVYFIGGIFYLRTQQGAKGIDQIPHRQFWFGLGNKVADCFSALCRCDQYCAEPETIESSHSQYSGGYSPIGEAAGKQPGMAASSNYERDSQLISP